MCGNWEKLGKITLKKSFDITYCVFFSTLTVLGYLEVSLDQSHMNTTER